MICFFPDIRQYRFWDFCCSEKAK